MADEVNINILDESITIELQDKEDFVLELNEQGPQGATGPQGPQGIQGIKGDKGEPGRDGVDGEPGPANVLSIGTVTKGVEASASITGDSPNQTLNLVLPKGDKGDRGEVGPKGEQGIQGRPGDIGPRGLTGERGPEGKAATITIGDVYESDHPWVTNSGSEQDVVLDFGLQKGETGPTGPRGISVTGVEEVSRQGLVSTYRMYFSNGEYFDYQVTDGSVSGITRDNIIQLLGFEPASEGAVEEINDLIPNEATTNNKLADKAWVLDNIPKEAEWGNITGNIENQLDLKEQLDSIYDTIGDEVEAIDAMLELKADKTQIEDLNNHLEAVEEEVETNTANISYLDEKVRDIELFKFPNAVIIGEPTISNGQVSGFSSENYMQFPFILDLHNTPFQIDFAFTTGNNVTTQQNILDSEFGLALAIANGKGLMAISSNGTSWDIGSSVGSIAIQPNTTYYARLTWDGMQYKTLISTNGTDYTQDMYLVGVQRPYPRTIFIGGCSGGAIAHTPHPFFGTINMNKAYLSTRGQVIWQGMDDAGLATRADISLSNLDELGEARFNAKQDVITDLDEIRDGASKGATAIQQPQLEAYHDSTKQDTLVSGTNIKTINGEDVLGSGDIEIESGGYHPNIFDIKWSDHLLNDIQWLRGDTFSWQSGDVYVTAYNTLVEEYATGTTETEGSVTFKRTTNGYKIADASQEANILAKYNTDGIAWYYILDTVNKQFKLPRTKYGFEGLRTNVGDDIAESLPNITGDIYSVCYWANSSTVKSSGNGAFKNDTTSAARTNTQAANTSGTGSVGVTFDASRSSSTYKNGAPVQERATQMYLYFYVGEYAREAIEQTAGLNTELFNSKVDLNASNLNQDGKSLISGLGMPSNRYIDLNLGASGSTYTAHANGWMFLAKESTAGGQQVTLSSKANDSTTLCRSRMLSTSGGQSLEALLPVQKNQVYEVEYNAGGKVNWFRFIYAEGSNN